MNFEISKDEYKNGTPRRYRLELSLTGALGLGTVLLLGLVWVFIFGVLVGRGYQPEKAVPELAKIMPETPKKQGETGVIQPEELTFLNTLREEPRHAPQASKPAKQKQQAKATAPAPKPAAQAPKTEAVTRAPATKPVATSEQAPEPQAVAAAADVKKAPEAAARTEATDPGPAPAPAEQTAPEQQQTPEQSRSAAVASRQAGEDEENIDQTRYDYVYQVASLSEPQSALRFRDKVRKLGLHSEVKVIRGDDKYWHRVVVQFHGRPIDTREMKAKLKTLGVDKPLLRSKVPAS